MKGALAWTPGWGAFTDAYGRSIFHVGREEGCENYAEARLDRGPGIVILGVSDDSGGVHRPAAASRWLR